VDRLVKLEITDDDDDDDDDDEGDGDEDDDDDGGDGEGESEGDRGSSRILGGGDDGDDDDEDDEDDGDREDDDRKVRCGCDDEDGCDDDEDDADGGDDGKRDGERRDAGVLGGDDDDDDDDDEDDEDDAEGCRCGNDDDEDDEDDDDDDGDADAGARTVHCRLTPKLWSDAERAELDAECDAIANLLVKADEMLARIALEDAKETPVKDPSNQAKFDSEIAKSEASMARAYAEWELLEYEDAICRFLRAWEHAQRAIRIAGT
jgi:hypothetical protein